MQTALDVRHKRCASISIPAGKLDVQLVRQQLSVYDGKMVPQGGAAQQLNLPIGGIHFRGAKHQEQGTCLYFGPKFPEVRPCRKRLRELE